MVRYDSILNDLISFRRSRAQYIKFNIYKPLAGTNFRENGTGGNAILRYYLPNGNTAAIVLPTLSGSDTSTHKLGNGGLVAINFSTRQIQTIIPLINRMYRLDLRNVFTIDYEIYMQRKFIFTPTGSTGIRKDRALAYFLISTLGVVATRINNAQVRVDIVSNHPNNNPVFFISGIKGQTLTTIPTQETILQSGSKSIILPDTSNSTTLKVLYQVMGSFQGEAIESDNIVVQVSTTPNPIPPTDPPDTTPPAEEITLGITLGTYADGTLTVNSVIHPRLPNSDNLSLRIFRKYDTEADYVQVSSHQNPAINTDYTVAFNQNIRGNIYATLNSGDDLLATSNNIPLRTESGSIVLSSDTDFINLLEKMPVQFLNPTENSVTCRVQSELLLLDGIQAVICYFTNGSETRLGQILVPGKFDFVEFPVHSLTPFTLYSVRVVIRYKLVDYDTHNLQFKSLAAMPINPTPEQLQERTLDKLLVEKLSFDDSNKILDLSLTQKELIAAGVIQAQVSSTVEDTAADQNKKNRTTRYSKIQSDSAFAKDSSNTEQANFAADIENLPSPSENDTGDYEV